MLTSYQNKSLQVIDNKVIADKRPNVIAHTLEVICWSCKHLLLKLSSAVRVGGSITCRHCKEMNFF